MKRRTFIAALAGAVAWPRVAWAQSKIPVIGYIGSGTPELSRETIAGLHLGLRESGYVEGRNLAVEYRWAEFRMERNAELAADLVKRGVSAIVVFSTPAVLAAKAATKTIPIVFEIGSDPVEIGLVANLNRPGGNLTGLSNLLSSVAAKRLEYLHELLPAVKTIGFLVNPTNPIFTEAETKEMQGAARSLGLNLLVVNAKNRNDFEAAYEMLNVEHAAGLVVSGDSLFINERDHLITTANKNPIPTVFPERRFADAGGLMSYGTDLPEVYRLLGTYVGRVLNGEKPSELPVQQIVRMELVLNMKTARMLDLTFPLTLLGRADAVIE
jgi:putative ABC transport system substrate-binding protein